MDVSRKFQCCKCKTHANGFPDDHQFGSIAKPSYCNAIIDDNRCTSTKFEPCPEEGIPAKEDYQEIRIQELTSWLDIGAVPRSITVVLRHDLVDVCKAGDEVTIIGWILSRWKSIKSGMRCENEFCLIANNIVISNNHGGNQSEKLDVKNFAENYWSTNQDNRLKGRDLLVDSFCPQIYGLFLVKLAVILTVIGGTANEDDPSGKSEARRHRKEGHILLVGDPGTGKSQFLVSAAKLSTRSVMTTGSGSTNAGLTVAAVKDSGEWQLEAGALVLADCGLCCIDEFNALRSHDRTSIHEAMEQQTLSVAKAGLVCKLQTRCSIIAACNSKGRFDEGELISSNVALASPLLSRFDLILVLADRKSVEWDRSLSQSILEAASKSASRRKPKTEGTIVDFETLKGYINYVRSTMKPTMSHGARIVLGKYYQLQRRADLRDAARTTIRLLESLIRLAQAHAKLVLQDSVEVSDAIWAIVLMETSLSTQSMLSVRPDVYDSAPATPEVKYAEYETAILKRLEINLKVIDAAKIDLDFEADEMLCSWPTTQKSNH